MTPSAYLATLAQPCACGHTAAWHLWDGACSYRLTPPGAHRDPRRADQWCRCRAFVEAGA
jgi:hypothetical protein